jgi:hypothetical protein
VRRRCGGKRGAVVAQRDLQRYGQAATRRVAGDGDPFRREPAVQQKAIDGFRVLDRRGERVLGRQSIVGEQDGSPDGFRQVPRDVSV